MVTVYETVLVSFDAGSAMLHDAADPVSGGCTSATCHAVPFQYLPSLRRCTVAGPNDATPDVVSVTEPQTPGGEHSAFHRVGPTLLPLLGVNVTVGAVAS
jgi:hypothetical protein